MDSGDFPATQPAPPCPGRLRNQSLEKRCGLYATPDCPSELNAAAAGSSVCTVGGLHVDGTYVRGAAWKDVFYIHP